MPIILEDWGNLLAEALRHYKERMQTLGKHEEIAKINLPKEAFADLDKEVERIDGVLNFIEKSSRSAELDKNVSKHWLVVGTALSQYVEGLEAMKTQFKNKLNKSQMNFE